MKNTLITLIIGLLAIIFYSCTESEATITTKSAMSDIELEDKDKYKDCTLFENFNNDGITITITKRYVDSTETIVKFDSIVIGAFSKDTLSRTSYELR